jgi:hypothetical protein
MGYRNKADCLAEAERLGLNVDGMSWAELQKTVKQALLKEELGVEDKEPTPKKQQNKKKLTPMEAAELKAQLARGTKFTLIPELAPDASRAIHYDEELGDDVLVEEKFYDIRNLESEVGDRNIASGTYVLKGKTGRKVVAESALPKENPGWEFTVGEDLVPVVTWGNKRGYRWIYVKKLLMDSGYYHQFKDKFKQPYIWYAAGILVCDIGLTDSIFREIMEIEHAKRMRGF